MDEGSGIEGRPPGGVERSAARGERRPAREEITARVEVRGPYAAVEQLVRIRPEHLVALAYLRSSPTGDGSFEAVLSARGWRRWLRLLAHVEFSRTVGQQAHAAMHLSWRSRRLPQLFPVMEADLAVRAVSEETCELVFTGEYRPPGGIVAMAADLLLGSRVALSTAESFLEDLRVVIERELARPATAP